MIEYIDADEFEELKKQLESSVNELFSFMDNNVKREPLSALAKVDLNRLKRLANTVKTNADYLYKIKRIR